MDYILEIDDLLTEDFCNKVISRFEMDNRKQKGATIGGVDDKIKKSIDLPISCSPLRDDWDDVVKEVGDCVVRGLKEYMSHMNDEGLDRRNTIGMLINDSSIGLPQIQKTEKGGYYKWHHDYSGNRLFTYIIYLNDVEEGIGGTTEFLCGKNIQPKVGKLVIFPSTFTYIHRGKKLEKGKKYILTNFVYDGIPIDVHNKQSQMSEIPPDELESIEEETPEPENDDI